LTLVTSHQQAGTGFRVLARAVMKGRISPRMFPKTEEPGTCRDDASPLTGNGMTMVIF
jgi:hypothetical protein